MDEVQGAILSSKLKDFRKHQNIEKIANYYLNNINNPKIILPKIIRKSSMLGIFLL